MLFEDSFLQFCVYTLVSFRPLSFWGSYLRILQSPSFCGFLRIFPSLHDQISFLSLPVFAKLWRYCNLYLAIFVQTRGARRWTYLRREIFGGINESPIRFRPLFSKCHCNSGDCLLIKSHTAYPQTVFWLIPETVFDVSPLNIDTNALWRRKKCFSGSPFRESGRLSRRKKCFWQPYHNSWMIYG